MLPELAILDISLQTPEMGLKLYIFGYGDEKNSRLLTGQSAEIMSAEESGQFKATMFAWSGDSGAPAIDTFGKVIGTGIQHLRGSNVATFVAMSAIPELLDGLPMTARAAWNASTSAEALLARAASFCV